jgi:hypothetical protein
MNSTLLGKIVQWLRRLFGVAERVTAPPVPKEAAFSVPRPTFHLQIKDADQQIPITLLAGQQLVLGWANLADTPEPFVDLSPYNAIEHGVSRQHAAILRDGQIFSLVDLGSINGTYLNGQRLVPHEPQPLQNPSEIRLGRLRVSYYEVHIPPPPRWIRLYTQSGNATPWWANGREWNHFLDLAAIHGWKPALGIVRAYWQDVVVSTEDAQALADTLENALPDLADLMERGFFGPRPVHEHWQANFRDLIAFCRLGGFRIGPSAGW